MPGADAAEDHFAEHDVGERNHAAERSEAVVHAVDRAATGVGGDGGEERALGDAVADFLALHVAAGRSCSARLRGAVNHVVRMRLGPVANREAGRKKYVHRCEDCPSVAGRAGHAAQRVSQACANDEDREDLRCKFENGVGFSYGCALLALKKPPPLVPSILMASCEATGP